MFSMITVLFSRAFWRNKEQKTYFMDVGTTWTGAFLKPSAGNSRSHDTKYVTFWYLVYCSYSKILCRRAWVVKSGLRSHLSPYPKDNWLVWPWPWHWHSWKNVKFPFSWIVFLFLLDNAYNTFWTKTWASFKSSCPVCTLGYKNQNKLLVQPKVLLPTDCVNGFWPCF